MRPRLGVLLGDPNGIGPELAARLLADPDVAGRAEILAIGDRGAFASGQNIAGVTVPARVIEAIEEAPRGGEGVVLLARPTIPPADVTPGEATAAAGRYALESLKLAVGLAREDAIDGFCFAPLNKYALRLGGSPFADEHELFAHELGFDGPYCEHNVLGDLWTTRVTSHIPLAEVARNITAERVVRAARLAHETLSAAGIDSPRIAVAALNPHAGDGGMFGREEIDVIGPAVEEVRKAGIEASGPFPADTVFLKARDGACDAVVTMYHDQGQVAMKLMGFNRGVTVAGGLPVPIATPASGTAFDIVGQGKADPAGMKQAFLIAARMAATRLERGRSPG